MTTALHHQFHSTRPDEGLPRWDQRPATLALAELVQRIVTESDMSCLNEIHTRPLFVDPDGRRVVIVGLITWLRDSAIRQDGAEIADWAYDLTISKFSSMPGEPPNEPRSAKRQKRKHIDCRYYYQALHKHLDAVGGSSDPPSVVTEHKAVHAFRRLILRHFRLSLREARRQSGWTRYVWHSTANGAVTVFMPRSLNGADRGKWLDSNIPESELRVPETGRRVQDIINDRLGNLDSDVMADVCHGQPGACPDAALEQITGDGLGRTVAAEKADAMHEQRPAIRALGAGKLQEMVERIFDRLADGHSVDVEIAREFGLSKATFSRFAGARWDRSNTIGTAIPDLWLNTAQILAASPVFTEAARRAGVWNRVLWLAECNHRRRGGTG